MRTLSVLSFAIFAFSSSSHAAISTVATSGGNAPGTAGAKFDSFTHVSLNSSGQGAFLANLQNAVGGVSAANDQVLYTFSGSSLSLRAQKGTEGVPTIPGANFANLSDVAIAGSGDIIIRGSLAVGTGGVTASTDQGLWRLSTGGDSLLARKGVGGVPDVTGGQFQNIPNVLSTTGNGDTAFAGQMVLGGSINSLNDTGIWYYQGTTGSLVAREQTSSVPGISGATFFALGIPSINNTGQGVAKATLKEDVGLNININNRNGVWLYYGTSGELLARQGVGSAPGTTGSFGLFGSPIINDSGQVAFRAEHSTNSEGLWKYTGATGELGYCPTSVLL